MANGEKSTAKRGVFDIGYGDDFDQFHGFGQNQIAVLPVPLVPSSPHAKPFWVSTSSTIHNTISIQIATAISLLYLIIVEHLLICYRLWFYDYKNLSAI